ncbi:MAG: ATP-grasp domain-containing protein [Rhodopirellula sp. JB044]|uniref:ATP-grasp domain-containing protein n=1 Tax=Rhodopirellula sp. JB044 TaxID=3342844 RepID=UPI00370BE1AA
MSANEPGGAATPRVFVAEYLCGGGMLNTPCEAIPDSLLGEGSSMWRALVDDFSQWAVVRTVTDPRLKFPIYEQTQVETVEMEPCASPWNQWIAEARKCDFAVVVIPETDGLLTKGISLMRAAGIDVLAPGGNAIGLSGDKWAMAKWLHGHDIPHPDTWCVERRKSNGDQRSYGCSRPLSTGKLGPLTGKFPEGGFLVKPRDGCGTMDIRRYEELQPALTSMHQHEITQQRMIGRSASVLVTGHRNNGSINMLPAVWQTIEEVPSEARPSDEARELAPTERPPLTTNQLVYRGGCGPIPMEMQLRAHALVSRVMQALPGKLSGFLGIDLILGRDANHDVVIELNSRLTTSYIGLRKMTEQNLTRLLFHDREGAPKINVPTESVQWSIGECAAALPGYRQ